MEKIMKTVRYHHDILIILQDLEAGLLKRWEGYFFLDEAPTEERVRELMDGSPFEIQAYFPDYRGTAHITSIYQTIPMKISFIGDGVLELVDSYASQAPNEGLHRGAKP